MLKTIPELMQEVSPHVRCVEGAVGAAERAQNNGLLVDVRETSEHLAKPVAGAINMPRGVVEMKMLELEKDPARPIYLHCASAVRARLAAEQLQRIGYTNVTVLTCGVDTLQQCF
ncbi:rhodanese-like domain-containing protein [Aestuariibacter halophilus]|uniref:Rhodanese-like domain-containing protein n=1 Tax=Fluctibacter halophilus TaxID=226011 RepID=A0ABS8GFZ6_9ALTE|nr:rhodanese-like domain-containing protein [Aestuariibacter halophilus]MCC2618106.1 rhodanese-like domain-containing protein [Aestuariibacter halophilus]